MFTFRLCLKVLRHWLNRNSDMFLIISLTEAVDFIDIQSQNHHQSKQVDKTMIFHDFSLFNTKLFKQLTGISNI